MPTSIVVFIMSFTCGGKRNPSSRCCGWAQPYHGHSMRPVGACSKNGILCVRTSRASAVGNVFLSPVTMSRSLRTFRLHANTRHHYRQCTRTHCIAQRSVSARRSEVASERASLYVGRCMRPAARCMGHAADSPIRSAQDEHFPLLVPHVEIRHLVSSDRRQCHGRANVSAQLRHSESRRRSMCMLHVDVACRIVHVAHVARCMRNISCCMQFTGFAESRNNGGRYRG